MDPTTVVNDTVTKLLAAEVPKLIAATVFMSVILAILIVFVVLQVQARRTKKETTEGQVALGLLTLANGINEQNKAFASAIEALRTTVAHQADLTRQTIQTLADAYKASAAIEEERIQMRLKIAERDAAAIDANTEALHAHSRTIGQLENAQQETANALTVASRQYAARIDKQAEAIAELIGEMKKLPGDVGIVVAQRLDAALSDFSKAKDAIVDQLKESEEKMIRAVKDIGALLDGERARLVPVPGFSQDVI